MNREEQANTMGRIIARAWSDPDFKQRLATDATAVLKEQGLAIPDGVTVRVFENTDSVSHLVIPMPPAGRGLSDDELGAIAAGGASGDKAGCGLVEICIHAFFGFF